MKRLLLLGMAAVAVMGAAFAFQAIDPAKAVDELDTYVASKMQEARSAGRPVNAAQLMAEVREKARKMVEGVDPAKVDARQAFDWAQLFDRADMPAQTVVLIRRYLGTNPPAEARNEATLMLLSALAETRDHKSLATELRGMTGATPQMNVQAFMMLSNMWARDLVPAIGLDETLKLMEEVEKRALGGETTLPAQPGPARSGVAAAAGTKADLLLANGQRDRAMTTLSEAIARFPAGAPELRTLQAKRTQIEIVGRPAPALNVERSLGDFSNLSAWSGKVVLVDFFAHWCGPCKASLPSLVDIYRDFKDRGLEIVHVTRFYGYYGRENIEKRDMPKDAEFERMTGFVKEHNMTWPVVFTDAGAYTSYGVTGIPHLALVDRKGNVRHVKVGFNQAGVPELRKKIEELLNER